VESLVFLEKVKREGWAAQPTDDVHKILGKPPRSLESWLESNKSVFSEHKSGSHGRFLILGASGNNGSRVATRLLEKKKQVVVGLRNPESKHGEEFKKQGAEVVPFDFTKSDTYAKAFQNIESVFILTPGDTNISKFTHEAVESSKRHGVKFIITISGAGADAKHPVTLVCEHGIADDYIKNSGINYSILAPTFFFTNLLFQAEVIKSQHIIPGASGGDRKYTWIHLDDIADAAVEIFLNQEKHKNTTYILTGPSHSDNELAALFSKVLGKEIKYVDSTLEQHEEKLKKNGFPDFFVEALVFLEKVKREGWAQPTGDLHKILGKEARDLESWLEHNKKPFES